MIKKYHSEPLQKGQIIIFQNGEIQTVHRIDDVQNVNGTFRYFTKGDANSRQDDGYLEKKDVIGKVKFKIKYIGWPTLWVRDIFKHN